MLYAIRSLNVRTVRWTFAAAVVVTLATAADAQLTAQTATNTSGIIEPKAKQILLDCIARYRSLKSYEHREQLTVTQRTQEGEERDEFLRSLSFEKPNKFRIQQPGLIVACDGQKMRVYYPGLLQYADFSPTKNVIKPLKHGMMEKQLDLVTTALLSDQAEKEFLEKFTSLRFVGQEDRNGLMLNKIQMLSATEDGTAWIGVDDKLMHQMTVRPRNAPIEAGQLHLQIEYIDQAVNEVVPPSKFRVEVSSDAKRVKRISFTRDDNSSLVGKPLPDMALPRLGGAEAVELRSALGRVTFVTLWANWCPPCRRELPEFQELFDTYQDKGFRVLAVCVDKKEDTAAAKAFADQKKLTFDLLSDVEGQLAKELMVRSIPTLLVVDSKGIIREVHLGWNRKPEFEYVDVIEEMITKKK